MSVHRINSKHALITASAGKSGLLSGSTYLSVLTEMLLSNSQPLWNLIPPALETKPSDVLLPVDFQKKYLSLMSQHLRQITWLKNFSSNLSSLNLPIVLMKGFGLWGDVYSPEYPRLSSDIDILVKQEDYERVKDLVSQESTYVHETGKHALFIIDSPFNVQVEIHNAYSEFDFFDLEFGMIFENSVQHTMLNNPLARRMSYEDSIIHTVIHAHNHLKLQPYMIVDLIRLFSQPNLDIDTLATKSREAGCTKLLSAVLERIQKEFGGFPENDLSPLKVKNSVVFDKCFEFVFNDASSRNALRLKPLARCFLLDKPRKIRQSLRIALTLYLKLVKRRLGLSSLSEKFSASKAV